MEEVQNQPPQGMYSIWGINASQEPTSTLEVLQRLQDQPNHIEKRLEDRDEDSDSAKGSAMEERLETQTVTERRREGINDDAMQQQGKHLIKVKMNPALKVNSLIQDNDFTLRTSIPRPSPEEIIAALQAADLIEADAWRRTGFFWTYENAFTSYIRVPDDLRRPLLKAAEEGREIRGRKKNRRDNTSQPFTIHIFTPRGQEVKVILEDIPVTFRIHEVKSCLTEAGVKVRSLTQTSGNLSQWTGWAEGTAESIPHVIRVEDVMTGPRRVDVDITVKIPGRRIACKHCGEDSHFHNKCPIRNNARERQTRPIREEERLREARETLALNTSQDFAKQNRRDSRQRQQQQSRPSLNNHKSSTSTSDTQGLSYAGVLRSPPKQRNQEVVLMSAENDAEYLRSLDKSAKRIEFTEKNLAERREREANQREEITENREKETTEPQEKRVTNKCTGHEENTHQQLSNRFSLLQHIDDDGNLTSGDESQSDSEEETETKQTEQEAATTKATTKQKDKKVHKNKRSRKEGDSTDGKQDEKKKRTEITDKGEAGVPDSQTSSSGYDVCRKERPSGESKTRQDESTTAQTVTIDRTEENTFDTGVLVIDLESRPKHQTFSEQQSRQIQVMADGIPPEHLSSAANALLAALDEPEALSNTFSLDPHYIDDSFAAQHLGGEGNDSSNSLYLTSVVTPGSGGGDISLSGASAEPKSFSTPLSEKPDRPTKVRTSPSKRSDCCSADLKASELKSNTASKTKFVKTKPKSSLSSRLSNAMTTLATKLSPPKSADTPDKNKAAPQTLTRSGSARRKANPSLKPAPQSKK